MGRLPVCALLLAATLPARGFAQAVAGHDDVSAAPRTESSQDTERVAFSLRLFAGAGIGTRDLALPRDGVVYESRTGIFPAADVAFELDHRFSTAFRAGLLIRYTTSIGLSIAEQQTDGGEHVRDLRSHRFELAIAPTLHFDREGRWALAMAVGYGLCDFRPEGHLVTPAYGLAGPYVRAELQFPLGASWLRMRIGPELQWIALVGQELVDRGVAQSGVGVGGAAAIELLLGDHWHVDATYRELRSWLDSSQPQSFQDVSRFITARLAGTL